LWRVYLLYFMVLIFGLFIFGKAIYIQAVESDELALKADEQELRYFNIEATRGNILARNHALLATSIPIFEARMDPNSDPISDKFFNDNIDSLSIYLSHLFKDKSARTYKNELVKARINNNRYYLIRRKVTYEELKQLRKFPIIEKGRYGGGLIIIPKTIREYPYKNLARRTLGYERVEEDLKVGLEGAYSEYLAGQNGQQLRRKLNNGDWIPIADKNELEPSMGKDIVSTIDVNIQDVAEHALHEHLIEHRAFQGCAVLMEVATGEIRAIANLRYDSTDNIYKESYNYAIGASIEPGSTFKLASLIAILETGKVLLTDTVDTGDGWTVYHGKTMRDVHKIRDGKITCREAFEQSSNVGVSKITEKLFDANPGQYIGFIRKMSLDQTLGIEIPGEGKPVVMDPTDKKNWSATSLTSMSIGYGVQLTPLQTLTFYNAVANGGTMVRPMFIKEIRKSGKTIQTFEPEILNKSICSNRTIDSVQSLLEGVVDHGTAKVLNSSIYQIAGKTGTAKIADKNRGYTNKYNASFTGYFPADNPKYSCIVVVNRPLSGKIYGGNVAAPVFKEIADKVYATHLDIPQHKSDHENNVLNPTTAVGYRDDITIICNALNIAVPAQPEVDWVSISNINNTISFKPKTTSIERVPNVTGMTARDAMFILESFGLKPVINGRGKVLRQSLVAGSIIKQGEEILLNLSTN